jgi:alkylation response protein AidB-like acyl-CoA dehydrogenase
MPSAVPPQEDIEVFRTHAREFLAAHAVPRNPLRPMFGAGTEDEDLPGARAFQARLHAAGFAGITIPRRYGGQGLGIREQIAWDEEAADFEVPDELFRLGIGTCAPVLLAHGSPEQCERFIRPMLTGGKIWCQLFSEPGAGSDLASARTSAKRQDGCFVVNGQKVWTSGAHVADYALLLARTDPGAQRHRGLTLFSLDMRAPGVTVRPLRQMNGGYHFNEVFLDDVPVPETDVVGDVERGWRAVLTCLAAERASIGSGLLGSLDTADRLTDRARRRKATTDPSTRQQLMRLHAEQLVLRLMGARVKHKLAEGQDPSGDAALLKLAAAGFIKRSASVALALGGPEALAWNDQDLEARHWADELLLSPATSIAGGTDEIMRNLIAERQLGLPAGTSRG